TSWIFTLSLHDALPIWDRSDAARRIADGGEGGTRVPAWPERRGKEHDLQHDLWPGRARPGAGADHGPGRRGDRDRAAGRARRGRSEEHTSELQSRENLV